MKKLQELNLSREKIIRIINSIYKNNKYKLYGYYADNLKNMCN